MKGELERKAWASSGLVGMLVTVTTGVLKQVVIHSKAGIVNLETDSMAETTIDTVIEMLTMVVIAVD